MLELAQKGEREAINALAVQVHSIHASWRPDLFCLEAELYPAQRYDQLIRERRLFAAKLEDQIIGYILIRIHDHSGPGLVPRRILTVEEMCVDQLFRGRGLGKQIIAEVAVLGRAYGCTDLQLTCDPHNEAAIRLYQSLEMDIKVIQFHAKL